MKPVTPDVLARCLEDLRAGRATLDELVSRYPEYGEELRPLLGIALVIPKPVPVALSIEFRARAREHLLTNIRQQRRSWLRNALDRVWIPTRRLGVALPLVLALVLTFSFAGAASAAHDALPGDLLYPVKTSLEAAQLALTSSEAGKARQHLVQSADRLAEIERAQELGRSDPLEALAIGYAKALAHAQDRFERALIAGEQIAALASEIEQELEEQQATLTLLQSRAAPQARAGLAIAVEAAAQGQARALERRGPKPKSQGTGSGTDTSPDVITPSDPVAVDASPAESPKPMVCSGGLSEIEALEVEVSNLSIQGQGLHSKLTAARDALARCQTQAAHGQLTAFMNQLNAERRNCSISALEYESLFDVGSQILLGSMGAHASEIPLFCRCTSLRHKRRLHPVDPNQPVVRKAPGHHPIAVGRQLLRTALRHRTSSHSRRLR